MKNKLRLAFALLGFLVLSTNLIAQNLGSDFDFVAYEAQHYQINKVAMSILGTWAIGNMLSSGLGYFNSSGRQQYFHQMNIFWNMVNLGLAGAGLYSAYHFAPSANLADLINNQQSIEKILLLNTGLDVAYMATGLWLSASPNLKAKPELLKGYGKSLILQGAFLFLFDIGFYTFQHRHSALLNNELSKFEYTGTSLKYTF